MERRKWRCPAERSDERRIDAPGIVDVRSAVHESVPGSVGCGKIMAEQRVQPDVHRMSVVADSRSLVAQRGPIAASYAHVARRSADSFDVARREPRFIAVERKLERRGPAVDAQNDHVHVQSRISGRSSMCSST